MLDSSEFETDFYLNQIKTMELRYSTIFKNWRVNWDKYYDYIKTKLQNKTYWIWSYLCGLEKFIQENNLPSKNKLYKDADLRIYRIIGDYYKIQDYVNKL